MERENAQESGRPLKIAFFIEGMYTSGVDTFTQLLAKALRRLGQRVVLFVPWKEYLASDSAEDVFLLPAMRVDPGQAVYLSYPISLPLIAEFKRQKFDLVHIHTSTSVNLLAWQVAKLFDLPIVYTYHTMTKDYVHYLGQITVSLEPLVDAAVKLYDKMVCNGADMVLTPSAKGADYLAQLGITPPVTVIPNGIDLQSFHPHPSDYLQRRFCVPRDAKVLLFVGRLNEEKRPLLAYEIFRALSRRHHDLCLVMVGNGAIGKELEQLAVSDGLQGRLILTGLVDYTDMHSVYNAADIWISTSKSEVHPMVALEAVACGLPAVAWRDRALDGIIEDGVNGFVVDTEEAFANAVQQLLADRELLRSMQSAAVHKIQAYSIEATAKQTLQLYAEVIKRHSKNAK